MVATDYHREIGFPKAAFPTGTFELEASAHARREAKADRYGSFDLPEEVTLTEDMYKLHPREAVGEYTDTHVFEITLDGGKVAKLGLRQHYDDSRDIILIIRPYVGVIVTAWINVKDDSHTTLDREKYGKPL